MELLLPVTNSYLLILGDFYLLLWNFCISIFFQVNTEFLNFVTVCGYNTKNGENVFLFNPGNQKVKFCSRRLQWYNPTCLSFTHSVQPRPQGLLLNDFINGGSSGVKSSFSKPAAAVGLNGEGDRKWKRKGNKTSLLHFPLSIPISPIYAFYAMAFSADPRLGVLFSLGTEGKNAWPKAITANVQSTSIPSLGEQTW